MATGGGTTLHTEDGDDRIWSADTGEGRWSEDRPLGLTASRVAKVSSYWNRRRWWTTIAAVIGILVLLSGAVSWVSQWQANRALEESGELIPATIYEAERGRNADLKLEYDVDGKSYRNTVRAGFFSTFKNQKQGDVVIVLVDPENPELIRTPANGNYSDSARFRLISAPFVFVLLLLSRGSFHVRNRLGKAVWYQGSFEVQKAGKGRSVAYLAQLWDADGNPVVTTNKMQGKFRSGRPKLPCHYAPLGKYALALPAGDDEGVLVQAEHPIGVDGKRPVDLLDE